MAEGSKFYHNVGMDESNNGQFPAIYVSVFSDIASDCQISNALMPKYRKNHKSIGNKLSKRDYRFLFYTQPDKDRIEYYKTPGVMLASLVHGLPFQDHMHAYIDGELSRRQLNFITDILHEATNLDKDRIEIIYGKDLDRKVLMVNIANETAHWLLRKQFQTLRCNPSMKHIRKEYC